MSNPASRGSWVLWLKVLGLLALILGLFGYIATVPVLFVPFIVAIVLNATFAPVVSALERRDWERNSAALLVFGVFAALLVAALIVIPRVATAEETRQKSGTATCLLHRRPCRKTITKAGGSSGPMRFTQ